MKLTKLIVVILLSTLIIVGCNSSKIKPNNEMTKITEKGEIEKIKNGYIFFSIKDCPLCKEVYPLVEDKIKDKEITMYYFDIYTLLNKKKYTNIELQNICINYNVESAPTIIKLKNGNEVSRFPSNYDQEIDELSKELTEFLKEN
ncbi:thioredoxin family protein [Thomasclavelia spiroformis]|uniref:thioredoxin family protein n=1 Tax=Thomasclavelia spiroformis TaxID=29348 RepID=UPI0039917DBE